MRSFGAGPARPVIRGLDGDRVAVLQDGQRVGDLSSQSGDHGVTLNPSSAQRIEVVRGPATLLYGANAIGGLVNVITDQIPTEQLQGASGDFTVRCRRRTPARPAAPATFTWATAGLPCTWVAAARRKGNFSTPEGEVENSDLRSTRLQPRRVVDRRQRNYVGASYGYDNSQLRHSDRRRGADQPESRASCVDVPRRRGQGLNGGISSYRATLGVRRYEHDELEGDEVGTHFDNDTEEAELLRVASSIRAVSRARSAARS